MTISIGAVAALVRRRIQQDTTSRAQLGESLADAVGGRVRGPVLLDADAQTIELPCVVLESFTGDAEYSMAVETVQYLVYTYSKVSSGHAMALYDAMYECLHGQRLWDPSGEVTLSGYAREVSRPSHGVNDAMKSYFARGTWVITVAG